MRMKDQAAIVTGSGRGIGRAIAIRLAKEGAKVGIFDLIEPNAKKVASEIEQFGGIAIAKKVDLACYRETQKVIEELLCEFKSIDILVNNVGINQAKLFMDTDEAFWDRFIAVNYKSFLIASQIVIPHMIRKNSGRIVSIASDAGRQGAIWEAIYCGTKGAIIATSKALARELAANNITVNCLCPGPTETDLLSDLMGDEKGKKVIRGLTKLIPLRRIAQPEEIADAVAFFASDEAKYITGQVLSVDGGLTMIG